MDRKDLNKIAQLMMSNDYDVKNYDLKQIQWSTFPDTLLNSDNNGNLVETTIEMIKGVIGFKIYEDDKTNPYYITKKVEGIELEYFPWGFEIYIYPDGYISYENGSNVKMYYPNSMKVNKILTDNNYPLI